MSKAMKGTGVTNKLSKTHPWHSVITIHNISLWDLTFIMVILFMTSYIMIVSIKKSKEFKTILLLQLVTIEVPSQSKLYNELSFESLKYRRWFRKLCTLYKMKTIEVRKYLFDLILITSFYSRTDVWKHSFFPYAIVGWNKLVKNIQEFKTIMSFLADSKTFL